MHAVERLGQHFVKLDEYLVGKGGIGRNVADATAEKDLTVGRD